MGILPAKIPLELIAKRWGVTKETVLQRILDRNDIRAKIKDVWTIDKAK